MPQYRAVGFGLCQRLTLFQRSQAARGELLILMRAGGLPGDLLGLEFAHDARRHPRDQRAARYDEAGTHKARRADDGLLFHDRVVHDDGADADQGAAPDGAAMQHRAMPDVGVLFEQGGARREGVQHA